MMVRVRVRVESTPEGTWGLTRRARTAGHVGACYVARLKRTARLRAAVHPPAPDARRWMVVDDGWSSAMDGVESHRPRRVVLATVGGHFNRTT